MKTDERPSVRQRFTFSGLHLHGCYCGNSVCQLFGYVRESCIVVTVHLFTLTVLFFDTTMSLYCHKMVCFMFRHVYCMHSTVAL